MQRILVIETRQIIVKMLNSFLNKKYSIYSFDAKQEVIQTIEEKMPALILLDLELSNLDGFEILKKIKSHSNSKISNIPVILISILSTEEIQIKGLQMGACDLIFEPVNPLILDIKIAMQFKSFDHQQKLQMSIEEKNEELKNNFEILMTAISILINEYNYITGRHVRRVQKYVKCILNNMETTLSDQVIGYISTAALLHDVGKIIVPENTLLKNEVLTEIEFDQMKTHTVHGANVLRKIKKLFKEQPMEYLKYAIEIAETHHEKFSGEGGYPYNLKGEEIPLSGRVVAIADVYDALRQERPYKTAFSHKEAYDIIVYGDDRIRPEHFDPKVLGAFKKCANEFEKIFDEDMLSKGCL